MCRSERLWPSIPYVGIAVFLSALLLGAAQFAAAIPARAGGMFDNGGPDGGGRSDDYGADRSEIYQVQRGDIVCNSRAACGGPAAIPMNRPGWFYLPGGLLPQRNVLPGPNAPYASYHVKHRHPVRR
jgi:hypothetical protein